MEDDNSTSCQCSQPDSQWAERWNPKTQYCWDQTWSSGFGLEVCTKGSQLATYFRAQSACSHQLTCPTRQATILPLSGQPGASAAFPPPWAMMHNYMHLRMLRKEISCVLEYQDINASELPVKLNLLQVKVGSRVHWRTSDLEHRFSGISASL